MENKLQVFPYEGKEIRTVFIENEPWWVAKDICDVFGETNRNRAMQALYEDEKGYTQLTTPGGVQQLAVVSEAGLYSLLFAMQPLKARGVSETYITERQTKLKNFRRWVTHEVLPSIRKRGFYAVDELLNNPDLLLNALLQLKVERSKTAALLEQTLAQEQQIIEMRPKAGYYDVVLSCKDAVPISVISKDFGWSAQKMNAFLHDCGVQYKQGTIWLLYQKYAENGYTDTKTHIYKGSNGEPRPEVRTQWTQKGRLFIYEIMKSNGYLPLIERG